MACFRRSLNNIAIVGLLVLGSVMLPANITGQAQSNLPSRSIQLPRRWTQLRLPSNLGGAPGNREGGATRGCPQLTALVPEDAIIHTSNPYPSFFWYTSPASQNVDLEFYLKNQQGEEVYSTKYKLAKHDDGNSFSGIMRFDLPASAAMAALEGGQKYNWDVVPVCNGQPLTPAKGTLYVHAQDPQLVSQLEDATFQEKVALYAGAGLWPETLSALYDLGRHSPNDHQLRPDLQQHWLALLNSVGLDDISKELAQHWLEQENSVQSATKQ